MPCAMEFETASEDSMRRKVGELVYDPLAGDAGLVVGEELVWYPLQDPSVARCGHPSGKPNCHTDRVQDEDLMPLL